SHARPAFSGARNRLRLRHGGGRRHRGAVALGPDRRSLVGRGTVSLRVRRLRWHPALAGSGLLDVLAGPDVVPRSLLLLRSGRPPARVADLTSRDAARGIVWPDPHVGHRRLGLGELAVWTLARSGGARA